MLLISCVLYLISDMIIKMPILQLIFFYLQSRLISSQGLDLLAALQCEEDPVGYIVPDPVHCNR